MMEPWPFIRGAPADLLFVVELCFAAATSVHILLRKRQVASAVGWLGLVWFAPSFGPLLYVVLGINRVQRRARRLRPEDRKAGGPGADGTDRAVGTLRPLARANGRITNRPLRPAVVSSVYQDGDQAYPAMLEAIGAARQSIAMSAYIFRNDEWGGRFIQALVDAHQRGVAVRVLIDGIGGGWLLARAYRRLRRLGVPAARFMYSILPWRMPFLNLRTHKKILVIDGGIGFTGGLNISDENVRATRPSARVRDLHVRFEGPVVRQLVEAFVQDWEYETGEDLSGPAWFPDIPDPSRAIAARIIDSGPDADLQKIEFAILQAVSCARRTIVVMTPYLLPDDRLVSALSMAAMRGVAVDVVIPARSDHRVVDWAVRANSVPLLSDGVRIWHSPPPFHHAKLMVVDGEWSLLGSANWDMRSFRLNFELCLEVYDGELAVALQSFIESCRDTPLTLADLRRRALPIRLRDAAARLLLPYL
ncbi:MAG: phospholipase D-like domain-containing protein [Acetobacteraceae bacterium]